MSEQSFRLFGSDLFGDEVTPKNRGPLAARFEYPPFSVLNARDGAWQERKQAWLSLGIKSELGRDSVDYGIGDKATYEREQSSKEYGVNEHLSAKAQKALGCFAAYGETVTSRGGGRATGTSVFDPVLCELVYRWFCSPHGQVIDPFAGGSVRGIVAGLLGLKYWGCDLRAEQITANLAQRLELAPLIEAKWECGDALDLIETAPEADLVFSCPPYGDLEVYSDDPRDLSTMEYHTFIAALKRIIHRCAQRMKPEAMLCLVVGDFRDKRTGNYRGFVADTVQACKAVGLALFNDAILMTPCGSLPIRVSAQFEGSRKLGKTHQNILVFRKG